MTVPPYLIVGSGCSQGHGGGGLYGAAMTEEEADAIADRLASEAECDDLLFWVEETPTSPGLIVREDDE